MLQFVTDSRYYVVRYTPSHYSNNPRYKYFNATDLNCMIDDLKPNTQYEFTVKVVKVSAMNVSSGSCNNSEASV
jgi:neogenin